MDLHKAKSIDKEARVRIRLSRQLFSWVVGYNKSKSKNCLSDTNYLAFLWHFRKCINSRSLFSGRRKCMGEQLAKAELYIFFTHLIHQFKVKKPDGAHHLP